MSVSTLTSEWFAAPVINESGNIEYIPLDQDILQLPVFALIQDACELNFIPDEDIKSGNWSLQDEKLVLQTGLDVRLTNEGVVALQVEMKTSHPKFISAPILTGCQIQRKDKLAVISIHYHFLLKKHNNREEKVSRYVCAADSQSTLTALNKFYKCIQLVIRGVNLNDIEDIDNFNWEPEHVLVIVNPKSGDGKGVHIFKTLVSRMLDLLCMKYKYVVTSYSGHAQSYASREQLTIYKGGIILISGDGLYSEFINGVMERMDRKSVCRVPLSIIPAGTNNTLSGSLLQYRGEHTKKEFAPVNCMFAFIKGTPRSCDVTEIRNRNLVYYSGLHYTWGNLADIYHSSKRFTILGKYRMVPLVMIKLLRNRGSDGSLWYRHISSPPDSELIKLQNNCFSMFLITNISNITFGVTACKNKFPGSGELVLCFVKYPISRRRIVSLIRKAISTGDHMGTQEFETIPIQSCVFQPSEKSGASLALCDGEPLPQASVEMRILHNAYYLKY